MPYKLPDDERELLSALAAGSEEAFTFIYNYFSNDIYNVSMVYLKDEYQAEETVQEVFLKIWANRKKMSEILVLKNYLFIIARNAIYNSFRKTAKELTNQKEFNLSAIAFQNNANHRLEDKEYEAIFQRAVNALPAQRKKIFLLAREEHLPYQDIADRLHISPLTVKKQMSIALKFIRERLQAVSFHAIALALYVALS